MSCFSFHPNRYYSAECSNEAKQTPWGKVEMGIRERSERSVAHTTGREKERVQLKSCPGCGQGRAALRNVLNTSNK